MSSCVGQLVDIYLYHETWHKTKLTRKDAEKYYQKVWDEGCITTIKEDGLVIAYVEAYRLDKYGMAKVMNHKLDVFSDVINEGEYCWIMDLYVARQHRCGKVMKQLKRKFFNRYNDVKYMMGEEIKRGRRLRVRTRR